MIQQISTLDAYAQTMLVASIFCPFRIAPVNGLFDFLKFPSGMTSRVQMPLFANDFERPFHFLINNSCLAQDV